MITTIQGLNDTVTQLLLTLPLNSDLQLMSSLFVVTNNKTIMPDSASKMMVPNR